MDKIETQPSLENNDIDSSELAARHQASLYNFPELTLNETEYVVVAVQRHPIGIASIWIGEIFCMIVLSFTWIYLIENPETVGTLLDSRNKIISFSIVMLLAQLVLLAIGWIGSIIYNGNRFYVTNEKVVSVVRDGLFSHNRNTIILEGIEDVRYSQRGILQTIFNYGSIRLSTVGEETTYPFIFVDRPKEQTRWINEAVIARKNNRMVNKFAIEWLN